MSAESSSSSSFSSMPESVCEKGLEFSESNNINLLMALMEETQEDQYYADDRLMDMIQSLEAELSSTTSSADPNCQSYDIEVGQVDDQDCSTSSISFSTDWDDMEVVSASSSSSSFDKEMMDAWSLCAAGGDYNSSDFCYGVLLENYLPREATDVVF